ncbi:hypothetical protein [Rossellomorea sp. BNER]|nr:hypothetical protein [Rossellomorea sp. BNER]
MKKQPNQHKEGTEVRQEEIQTIKDFTNKDNRQPEPQPKDYDEIEY